MKIVASAEVLKAEARWFAPQATPRSRQLRAITAMILAQNAVLARVLIMTGQATRTWLALRVLFAI